MVGNIRMYDSNEEPGLSNEALASGIQKGNTNCILRLLSRNEGFLTRLAISISGRYGINTIVEDLKQEGAMALIGAAQRFDASKGVAFLSYARSAVQSAMLDYTAGCVSPVSLPPTRFHRLRQAFQIYTSGHRELTDEELVGRISREMKVSEKTARNLLAKSDALFSSILLGDHVYELSSGGDPARIFGRKMAQQHLHRLMANCLTARELNLIRRHCGFDDPNGEGMTFEMIAVRMNFNSPAGSEKAFKHAVEKLRKCLGNDPDPWVAAERAIRAAHRKCQEPEGYIPPAVSWCQEEWELVKRFPVMIKALIAVFTILHEALEKDGLS